MKPRSVVEIADSLKGWGERVVHSPLGKRLESGLDLYPIMSRIYFGSHNGNICCISDRCVLQIGSLFYKQIM